MLYDTDYYFWGVIRRFGFSLVQSNIYIKNFWKGENEKDRDYTVTKYLIITPEEVENISVRPITASGGYDDAYITWEASPGALRSGMTAYFRTSGTSMKLKAAVNKEFSYKVRPYKIIKKGGELYRVYVPWSDFRTCILK